ncbi:alkaline phosphatase family protein [Nonomuraea aurantiaca]|uniref:alkaline phosphatase family protein n=1 Tax=Nonomuraea aurantiaca TaxID=2878562 RepID=UPI001CD9A32E|nr:alkaline phosphatase family protein [Nonomuraea aurantiaca]MCA2220193.1 alkaline phosphatase family protein [Nonomuraea aurantiaca]
MRDKVLVVGMDGLRFDRLVALEPPVLSGLMAAGAYGTSLLPYGEAAAPRTESPGEIVPEDTAASGEDAATLGEGSPASSEDTAASGEVSSGRVIRSRTDSGPGWSSIATGVWPDRHGVVDNAFTHHQFAKYPDFLTRANAARPDLTTAAFFSWAALAEHGAFGPAIGTRFVLDGYAITWPTADKQVAAAAENHLASTGADLTFVYLGETDEVAHDLGPHCPDYTAALHTQDAYLGRFLDAIRGRPTFAGERWTVLVTTDHGHVDEGGHGGTSIEERTVFVIAARLSADLGGADLGSADVGSADLGGARLAGPRLVDVGPTALALLGIESDPACDLDGVPLEV